MKAIYISFLLLLSISSYAQTLSAPESVEYDAIGQRWFISNNGSNQIFVKNNSGVTSVFTSAPTSGPHGLEIVGNILFACDGGSLKGYDLTTAAEVVNVNLGATFLNGITHDNSGNLYITDFSAKKIYRYVIATQAYYTYVTGLIKSPNGIVYDDINNRLVFVNWGSNAPIMAVNMADSTTSTLTSTTLGNCDGITMNCQGEFFVSSWSPNRISQFDNNFASAPTNMNTPGLSSPADIFFAQAIDELGVPNSGNNTVGYHSYPSCGISSINTIDEQLVLFNVINHPNSQLQIDYFDANTIASIRVHDIRGALILSENVSFGLHSFDLDAGMYTVEINNGTTRQFEKVIVVR